MPSRDWRLRLQDILESIREIERRTKGMTFEEFAKNQTTIKAVLYDFIIIGEATRNVPKEIHSRHPLIPWRLMGGMRNGEHLTYAMSINAYSSQKLENPELDHKEK